MSVKKDTTSIDKMVEDDKRLKCGLIMPISALDGCSSEHWAEVKSIITESVESITEFKFVVKLVSESEDIGVIQKRIVQNIYGSDIVLCDVSGKNPNVMFELGMRLAFDKPTVIIKDDVTDYSFDTSIIEHVAYPRDLRFKKIIDFKKTLAAKVQKTYAASLSDPDHSPFLKNFGKFQVAAISETVISSDKMIIEMLSDLHHEVVGLKRRSDLELRKRDDNKVSLRAYNHIASSLNRYLDSSNIEDMRSLLGNENFYRFVEQDIDAGQYFGDATEFENVLEKFLRNKIRSEHDIPN